MYLCDTEVGISATGDLFYFRRFCGQQWNYVALVRASLFSRQFFETLSHETKEKKISRSTSTSFCTWLSQCGLGIASVLQQFRATISCCSLSLSFNCRPSVLKFLQTFLLLTVHHPPKILFDAEPMGSTRFSPLQLTQTKMGKMFSSIFLQT